MSEIRTNLTISGDNLEYRCKISISVITLDTNLVDTQSSFRTNLNIESSNYSTKTILELNNERLDFYLVDVNKIKKTILYFSNILNTNFEPELLWSLLEQNTNEQINISHLTEALKYYLKKEDYEEVINILEEHTNNNIIHISQQEREFIEDIMINKPWEGMSPGGGGSEVSYTPIVTSGEHLGNIIINGRIYKIYSPKPNLNGYATEQWVKGQKYLTQHQDISHLLSKTDATDTYATIESLNNTSQIITNIGIILNDWFTLEEVGGEKVLKTKYNLASEKAISWKGVSTSGGGTSDGGLIKRVYGYEDIADTYDDNVKTETFNAYTIAKIAERVSDIEKNGVGGDVDLTGYATENWVLNQGYLTSVSFSEILNKPTTLAGYGITDALSTSGGTINGSYNPLTLKSNDASLCQLTLYTNDKLRGIFQYNSNFGVGFNNSSVGGLYITNNSLPTYVDASNNIYTLLHEGNFNSYALPLSGGTLTGDLTIKTSSQPKLSLGTAGTVYYSETDKETVLYNGGAGYPALKVRANTDAPIYRYNYTDYTLIHSGNIGSQSVNYATSAGDAGTLGGINSDGFLKHAKVNYTTTISSAESISQTLSAGLTKVHITNVEYSSVLTGYDYDGKAWQLRFKPSYNDGFYFRSQGTGTDWKKIAFTDSNVASASKLQTARTIWGQSFDGTGDVSGDLKIGNSNILDGNNRRIVYSSGTDLYFGTSDVGIYNTYLSGNSVALRYGEGVPIGLLLNNKGNVLIGTTTEDYSSKLLVNGNISSRGDFQLISNSPSTTSNSGKLKFNALDTDVAGPYIQAINAENYGRARLGIFQHNAANYSSATEVMSIMPNGNVLMGSTTDNGNKLQVEGNIKSSKGLLSQSISIEKNNEIGEINRVSNKLHLQFRGGYGITMCAGGGNVLMGTISDNGNKLQVAGNISATGSISWGAASDRRLKDNIKSISNEDAINVIMALNPVTFEWNKTATEKDNSLKGLSCGFVADEYTKVIPNSSRPIWEEYTAIDYKLTAAFVVKGLQSHEERLRVLERENRELKNELNKLRGYGN